MQESDILINHPFTENLTFTTIFPVLYPLLLKHYLKKSQQSPYKLYTIFPLEDYLSLDRRTAYKVKLHRLDNEYISKIKLVILLLIPFLDAAQSPILTVLKGYRASFCAIRR